MNYADVIIPLNVNQVFTYSIPESLKNQLKVGCRVVVNFGMQHYYSAIVLAIHDNKPDFELKNIEYIIDNEPIVNEKILGFWQWMASYYMCSLGDIMNAALPAALRLESTTHVYVKAPDELKVLDNFQKIQELFARSKSVSVSKLTKFLGNNALKKIDYLVRQGILEVSEIIENKQKKTFEIFYKISSEINSPQKLEEAFEKIKKSEKQTLVLSAYCTLSKLSFVDNLVYFNEVSKKQLIEKSKQPKAVIDSLCKKGILIEYHKEKIYFSDVQPDEYKSNIKQLTTDQQLALDEIKKYFEHKDVVLLHGITASGKTEIYIQIIKEFIEKDHQVLYLLPEIALTYQIIQRLKSAFGEKIIVYHSSVSEKERAELWQRISSSDEIKIVVGVRSAIFLPFKNLGLIIVDEEHENTFKQKDPAPRYHARDSAIMLAKFFGGKVLLGSATPSLESYYNAQVGKYGYVYLGKRFSNFQLPNIEILDLRKKYQKNQKNEIFHNRLLDAINEALEKKEQIIVFQNRRGFANYLQCDDCQEIVKCVNCDVSLTYHKDINRLVCHHCGYVQTIPKVCPTCKSEKIFMRKFGTQRLENELSVIFPNAKIARLDLDSIKRKNTFQKILQDFNEKKIDILVGTQMITKGLDFENVTLVGVVDADFIINFPDFRSNERAFQLLTQVSGRAGRSLKTGKVYIQTYTPNHYLLDYIRNNNFEAFYKRELNERLKFKYPPFVRLIKIITKHKNQQLCYEFSNELAQKLKSLYSDMVIGPYEPIVARIKNYYFSEILLKLPKKAKLDDVKKSIYFAVNELSRKQNYSTVKVFFNVDP